MGDNKPRIPFIQISEELWPSQCKSIRDHQLLYKNYAFYVICNSIYMVSVGILSVCLFKYQWIGFIFICSLFGLGCYKGFNMFLSEIDAEMKAAKNKKIF